MTEPIVKELKTENISCMIYLKPPFRGSKVMSRVFTQRSRGTQRLTMRLNSIAEGKDESHWAAVDLQRLQSMSGLEMKTQFEMHKDKTRARAFSDATPRMSTRDAGNDEPSDLTCSTKL